VIQLKVNASVLGKALTTFFGNIYNLTNLGSPLQTIIHNIYHRYHFKNSFFVYTVNDSIYLMSKQNVYESVRVVILQSRRN